MVNDFLCDFFKDCGIELIDFKIEFGKTSDGTIIPLKIRITDEDGEYQVYNIKSYKDVSNRTAYTMPNGASVAPANHLWKFECKICAFNTLKRIQLFYNANENSWKVFYS